MLIIKGKYSGFCFGVKRAIESAENMTGERRYVLGEIIHNESVIEKLKNKGLIQIDSLDDFSFSSNDSLLIRTHGEPESTFIKANNSGVNVVDCTCPFVKDIQKIVKEKFEKGYKIVIIGNSSHPEVIGINGWCNNSALITELPEDINLLNEDKICVVSQTTYSEEKFEKLIKKIDIKGSKIVDIFKTICYTTSKRQKEAEYLSSFCDAMIVIGGTNSNNTQKLFDICSKNCKNSFKISDPNTFAYNKIKKFKKVGIVFGASTPIEQFQEVISNMEKVVTEEIKTLEAENVVDSVKEACTETTETPVVEEAVETVEKTVTTSSKKSEMEKAFNQIKPNKDLRIGQIVTAKISSANENGLTLSLLYTKKDFELSKDELINEYKKEDYKDKIGNSIRVMVVGKNPVRFSEKAMSKVLAEEAEIEEIKNGKIFEAEVVAVNKGGLTAKFNSYSVFVPASQIKLGFVKDLEKYVGKTLRLKAEKVESRGPRRQIVASQKVILQAEKEERDAIKMQKEAEFFSAIQEGDVVVGTPVRFSNFGAFIDVNGFDCLAHISDLSWTGCKDCSEVLEIGKQYEFKILKIDLETKRVSVGYKQLQPKPWDTILEKYNVGDIVKGKVVRIVNFGAFVEIEKGIDGLVHVSQISNKWLENPVTALEIGQEVDAKIIDINPEKEKMTLSIKALLPEEETVETTDDKKSKGKKAKKTEETSEDLHEWKENDNEGVSIAELLQNK